MLHLKCKENSLGIGTFMFLIFSSAVFGENLRYCYSLGGGGGGGGVLQKSDIL